MSTRRALPPAARRRIGPPHTTDRSSTSTATTMRELRCPSATLPAISHVHHPTQVAQMKVSEQQMKASEQQMREEMAQLKDQVHADTACCRQSPPHPHRARQPGMSQRAQSFVSPARGALRAVRSIHPSIQPSFPFSLKHF